MPNSSTLVQTLPINVLGSTRVFVYSLFFDTTGTDLTVRTAATGKMHVVCGLIHDESTAHTLTIKSGASTTIATLEKAGGYNIPINSHVICATTPGEALTIRTSAAISQMTVYLIEMDSVKVD